MLAAGSHHSQERVLNTRSNNGIDEPIDKKARSCFVVSRSENNLNSTTMSINLLTNECIGRGRSGKVYKIVLDNKEVACKIYDTYKVDNDRRMKRELMIYDRLKACQGSTVPLIHSSVTVDGEIIGFCMTLLRPLPWKLSHWTKDEKYRAKGLLIKLADLGVFHDDIKTDNFGVTQDNRMMVFDFEDATISDEIPDEVDVQKYTTRYKKRVCRLFKENK